MTGLSIAGERGTAQETPEGPPIGMSRARVRLLALGIVALAVALHLHALPLALGRFRNVEETYRAHIAWTFLHGIPEGWGSYVYGAYEQGSLVTSALLMPAFAALGPTVLATKLVALGWTVAKMIAFLALAMRLLGTRDGLCAGCLAALVSPGIAVREVCAMGDIQDAQLLIYAHWWTWLGLRARSPDAPAWRGGLAFGALGGACLAYNLATLPSIATALVLWPLGRARNAAREAAWVGAGFAAALIPVIANWAAHGVAFLAWRGRPLAALVDFEGGPLAALSLVFGPYLADALALHPLAPPTQDYAWILAAHRASLSAICFAGLGTIALGVLGGIQARRCVSTADPAHPTGSGSFDPALAIVALHAAYLLAFAASSQRLHYWLFLLVPTGALLVVRVATPLAHAGVAGRAGAAVLAAAYLALPAAAWWRFPPAPPPGPVWGQLAHRGEHWATPLAAGKLNVASLEAVDHHAPLLVSEAWGTGILLGGGDASDAKLTAIARRAGPPAARRFAAGVGYSRGWGRRDDDPRGFARECPFPDGPVRAAALEGYGQATGEALGLFDLAALEELYSTCPSDARAFAAGLGDGVGFGFWHLPAAHTGPFVPDALWGEFRRGLLARLARDFPTAAERGRAAPRTWDSAPAPPPASRAIRHALAHCAFTAPDADDEPSSRTALAIDAGAGGLHGVWIYGGAGTCEVLRLTGPGLLPVEGSLLTNRRERLGWVHLGATVLPRGPVSLELAATGQTPRVVEVVFVPGDPAHD